MEKIIRGVALATVTPIRGQLCRNHESAYNRERASAG